MSKDIRILLKKNKIENKKMVTNDKCSVKAKVS